MSTIHFIAGVLKPELPKCKCSKCSILSKTVVNLFILATGFCFSQECNLVLEGKVVDLHDNSPVSAAVIQVVGSDETVFSNADGVFKLENQCPKKINLKISHLNCEDLYTEFNINKSTSRRFYLEHHIESLEEVVVEESKIKKLSSTAPSYALTELQKDQYSGRGLAKALEQISGVNILNTGNVISKPSNSTSKIDICEVSPVFLFCSRKDPAFLNLPR